MTSATMVQSDRVFVRGLEFEANHGWYEEERRSQRRFRVSVELKANLSEAASTDKLSETIDYFEICQIIVDTGTSKTFKLLERLAGAIGEALLARYPGTEPWVEIEKLGPPCPGVPQCCGVRLQFGQ